jgi:hypothetical protein
MARKHAFFIVVLLAAAALAGFVAVARTVDLAQPATATAPAPLTQSALEARLRDLDRFEAKLRKQLAAKPPARSSAPATLVSRVAASPSFAYEDEDDDDDYEDEGDEDDD